ncbi:MAG: DUF2062 domain-containing protein [Desulfobacterales bacterium]|nr:MAG: DUF2062 domain-containing protein [Desulfobacterales bacterium]
MQHPIKIMIVIPVYNHGRTLRDVVTCALGIHAHVLVVDDGSRDGGPDTLAGLDVHIIRHPKNRGKGAALLTAAAAARKTGMTHMVTIDADGQHDPHDLRHFIPAIQLDPQAIIVGNRNLRARQVPRSTRFGRRFSNFWFRLQTGQGIGDTQSGFRAYPLVVLEKLKLREKRYAFEIEALVKAAWAGVRLREVAISVFYPPHRQRVSHFHIFRDNLRLSWLNCRLTLRSIVPVSHRQVWDQSRNGEKISVWRPVQALRKLLTENTSPAQLATAGALGVFLGALPLIACHTVVILLATGFFRLHRIAALSTSQLCMPPLVPALCIEIGYFMRHGRFLTEISLKSLGYQGVERCYEWLLGSLVLAPVMALIVGGIIYLMARLIRRETRATQ